MVFYITEYMIWYKNYISKKLLEKKKKRRKRQQIQDDLKNSRRVSKGCQKSFNPFISKKVKSRLIELNHLCYTDSKT